MENECSFCTGTGQGYSADTICPVCRGAGKKNITAFLEETAATFIREKANPEFFLHEYRSELLAIPRILGSVPKVTESMRMAGWLYWYPHAFVCSEEDVWVRFGRQTLKILNQISNPLFLEMHSQRIAARIKRASWEARTVDLIGVCVTMKIMAENEVSSAREYALCRRHHIKLLVKGLPFDCSEIEEKTGKYMAMCL